MRSEMEVKAGSLRPMGALVDPNGDRVRSVSRLIAGRCGIAEDAEHGLRRRRGILRRKAGKFPAHAAHQVQKWRCDFLFVEFLVRLKPLAPAVALQLAQ